MLFIDLDHFKNLNDSLGHHAGDEALRKIARRLRLLTRADDVAARLGGDEFVILMTGLDADELERDATRLVSRILATVREPLKLQTREYALTCSIGIALSREGNESSSDVLRWADLAMYSAKDKGRDHFRFFDPDIQQRMLFRTEVEQELRVAIAAIDQPTAVNRLWLTFQPLVDPHGQTVGYESLLRWTRPSGEPISPEVFIPIAEQSALILPIGQCQRLATQLSSPSVEVEARIDRIGLAPGHDRDRGQTPRVARIGGGGFADPQTGGNTEFAGGGRRGGNARPFILLRQMGCDRFQGYHFGKPAPLPVPAVG